MASKAFGQVLANQRKLLCPGVQPGHFAFVDDFLWLLRSKGAVDMAGAVRATPLALGTPLSWKKTHLAEVNTWLGFLVHPNLPQFLMAANKHILVMEVLQIMVEGQARHAKEIEKALGRIQWATSACPLPESMPQPLCHHHGGKTTSGGEDVGTHATSPLQHTIHAVLPCLPKSSWRGCGDAGASDLGEA